MTTVFGVLVSGRGSNLDAILRVAEEEGWDARFVVGSNRPEATALEIARSRGLDSFAVDHRAYADRDAFDAALAAELAARGVEWVVLAGFMRILGPRFLDRFPGRVLNIHPSLLPELPGRHTHRRALEAGLTEHGCTVHRVTAELDAGPILGQARVPVLPGDDEDSLAARVLAQEHRLYPAVLRSLLGGTLATGASVPAGGAG